jgi:hypothetical protein
MYIRFAKGRYVDAIIPSGLEWALNKAPGDIVYEIPEDINPTKTVNETRNVQATDELTGQPIFDDQGAPVWARETATDSITGEEVETIVTEDVEVTYKMLQNPNIFTPDDILDALGDVTPTIL